jgi:hypothetical protein
VGDFHQSIAAFRNSSITMAKNILVPVESVMLGASHTVFQLLLSGFKVVVDISSAFARQRVKQLNVDFSGNLSFH